MDFLNALRFVISHPLNRGRRLAALFRVLRWQLATRLLPEAEFALPFVDDTRLLVTRGMTGATGNFYCGLHESDEMGLVLHVLRAGELFVDIGANIGSFSILAGTTGARVISVEPIAATHARLTANIRVNGLSSTVTAYQRGLSDRPGTLRFTASEDTINHVATAADRGAIVEVEVMTLDALLGDEAPTLLKIDVEGHELAVLRGAEKTFGRPSLLAAIVETNESGSRYGVIDSQLGEFMLARGFVPYSYSALTRRFFPRDGRATNAENTVFIRRTAIAELEARVATASKHALINGSL